MLGWDSTGGVLARLIAEQTQACLAVYREDPSRVEQDANNEMRIFEGGYSTRQLLELIQNAVDAARNGGGRIEVVLTADKAYVANDGAPFDEKGVLAVMASDLSPKQDEQIGRFGIGFKSVLAVTKNPQVYSRTVSFEFEGTWARDHIRAAGFRSTRYPIMRLARVVDPTAAASADEQLRGLMEWASTVVVLPLIARQKELAQELQDFQAEFVLFSPHISLVRLRDLSSSKSGARQITARHEPDGSTVLTVDGKDQRWQVLSGTYKPSVRAAADGGRIAGRDTIPVQWAVPIPPRPGIGAFWAYFPTQAETTLSGIVNAPWKLSDDRRNVLEGPFNEGILEHVLPKLIASGIARVHRPESPAGVLDVLPARGRENRSWADKVVNEPIFDALRSVRCLPDGNGDLRRPADLRVIPEDLHREWVDEWASCAGVDRSRWVHPAALTTPEQRLKARRLTPRTNDVSVTGWLEAMTADPSAENSAAAIRLAARIIREIGKVRDETLHAKIKKDVKEARIIRLENGDLVAAQRGSVFVRATAGDAGHQFVDRDLAGLPGLQQDLASLDVVVYDHSGKLRTQIHHAVSGRATWEQVWTTARLVPVETAHRILVEEIDGAPELVVQVRTGKGTWRPICEVYLAGTVVPADGSHDRDRVIHPRHHAADGELLELLGAVSQPAPRNNTPREAWRDDYEADMRQRFLSMAKNAALTAGDLVVEGRDPAWPLAPLATLSTDARLAVTEALVARGVPVRWAVTAPRGKRLLCLSPEAWLLRRHGLVRTPFGPLPPTRAIRRGEGLDTDALPIVDLADEVAEMLGTNRSPGDLTHDDWLALKAVADRWTDDLRRADFYAWLPAELEIASFTARVGQRQEEVPAANIGVTADAATYQMLVEAMVPALQLRTADQVERFVLERGMRRGKDLLDEEVVIEPSGEPEYMLDRFPPLKLFALEPDHHELQLQHCTRLERMVATTRGQIAHSVRSMRDGDRVLVTALDDRQVLHQISHALGLGLDDRDVESVVEQMARKAATALRRRIQKAPDHNSRLVEAVGVDQLQRLVPSQALAALFDESAPPTPVELAALARAVHGDGILKQLRTALEDQGLEPPRDWTGKFAARQFVTELGFPIEWAGFPTAARPASETIDGPAVLNELHAFQTTVTERIKRLLRGSGPDRGVVSLPTGAGKTRVTVQALVEEVVDGRLAGPIVWIAQSDELCEQAAETWAFVWRAVGPSAPLSISRLWAGNEAVEDPGALQLVVATVDKLDSIRGRTTTDYNWLTTPSVVVVDEAHTSIAPSYTRVLNWLGRDARARQGRSPLIGLTATPFRGVSSSETERLVNRYDHNRLDEDAFEGDPYEFLQREQVLANVKQVIIDGVSVDLRESELSEIRKMNRVPAAVENRLGADLDRSRRIVDHIRSLPEDWTALLFATSVENARTLAAMLAHRGVPAVSVSADTDPGARRNYVEQFKKGTIRVLTNYNVLSQGFDAPAVRAVYVTRPTFSPNLYQQMIGRGLRGPKNGGSEEVLIVNVQDNFQEYGEKLAFREFEYLWRR